MKILSFFYLLFSFNSIPALASEAELFVEIESLKNEVLVSGYNEESHKKILEVYEQNKNHLNQLENPSLAKELIGLTRSSTLVQKLKKCVNTNNDKINKSIDALFISAAQTDCISSVFEEEALSQLTQNTDSVLEVMMDQEYDAEKLRKELFEEGLPSLVESYDKSRSKFSDVDDKFMQKEDQLFPLLPKSKVPSLSTKLNSEAPTYEKASQSILGPIGELYREVYGEKSESALTDNWKDVYTQTEGKTSPHIFGAGLHDRSEEIVKNEFQSCFQKAQSIKDLQERAKDHFTKLDSLSYQMGLQGIIQNNSKLDESYEELGFSSEAKCISLPRGNSVGTPRMDKFGAQISKKNLDRGFAEDIAMSGDSVVLTLGNLGSDPNNVYKPIGRETLDTRSYLDEYTTSGIKNSHNKALEGMLGFINHMGRRVYKTESTSATGKLLNMAGDTAQALTSLGDSTEVDIALLLMANPSQGMKSLIQNPLALNAFCKSFKALRNQENVNLAIDIASALSMFTGVGGMFVKGASIAGKGLRVSNLALAGADSVSIIDSMTHARDLALASACEQGDESLCQSYLDSDRNMTLAIAGLALSGAGGMAGATKLTKRLRGALLLRNGDNPQGLIRDNHKLLDLLNGANPKQKSTLLKIVNSKGHSEEEIAKLISLIQNNENAKTLDFLNKYEALDEASKKSFIAKLLKKLDESEGGVCRLPS